MHNTVDRFESLTFRTDELLAQPLSEDMRRRFDVFRSTFPRIEKLLFDAKVVERQQGERELQGAASELHFLYTLTK
jgi:hypothetical protein